MPVPVEYQRIQHQLYRFLEDARDFADVDTTHRAYTMSQGVFQVFRRWIDLHEAIRFSNILPAGIRFLFVAEWDPGEPRLPFGGKESMVKEVQSLRPSHNFSPPTAIRDVARALCRNVNTTLLDHVLSSFSADAQAFWNDE